MDFFDRLSTFQPEARASSAVEENAVKRRR
jgi:hypothetical protein